MSNNLPALKNALNTDQIKKKFSEMLGKKAPGFISSIITAVSSNDLLSKSDVNSIIGSAAIAATLDLPINQNLGFAYIVPYSGKAQFQMGYKGFIQLAMRTGQYKTINACLVYDGELEDYNRLTGMVKLDYDKKASNKVIGFVAYFSLINGFEKMLYMTTEEIERHGKNYSKSFTSPNGRWKQDFEAMGLKTVIKLLLSKYGILSIEMQKAVSVDQGIIDENENIDFPDNEASKSFDDAEVIEATTSGELFEENENGEIIESDGAK